MSTPTRTALALALLVLVAVFGVTAVAAAPDGGLGIGIWPVALATATLVLGPRPGPLVWACGLAVLASATVWVGGREPEVAVGLGTGLAAQAWVTWRIACAGRRERARLLTIDDLSRFLGAVSAGALTMAAVSAVTSAVTGWGPPPLLALTTGTAGLAAQLTLLPFFCVLRRHPPVAGVVERCAQWTVLLAVTVAVLVPTELPSLALLVLPVLAWGALRNGSYEALAQMAVAVSIAIPVTTAGHGPFARADERFDLPVDTQGVLLATFAAVCAGLVLTLLLTVGEQHENARQVGAERDRLRNVVDGIDNVAIIGADLAGRITLFNPGAQRLLGYAPEEVLGRSTTVLHSDRGVAAKAAELGLPADYAAVGAALVGRGPTAMGFVRKDGEERQHWVSINQVLDEHGEVTGYVSTSEDITERLRAEARLTGALATERQAVEQLREVDRIKDAFVSSVSHELRTPITSILGYTEMLGEGALGALTAPQADAVDRVGRNSQRLLALISELLTLSKVEAGAGTAGQVEPIDLTQVVSAAVAVLSPTVARRDLDVTVALPTAPVPVRGDRDMLERVVINLTDNAVKFTPDGGRVTVALTAVPGHAVLEVADSGIGVPAHEQQRLFDRFFRSSLAQQHAIPGSGLGLSIARTIVEQHGGTLEVASQSGRGSTFRVRLPAAA